MPPQPAATRHDDGSGPDAPPPAPANLRGLAACLTVLEQEAIQLAQPLAAHFIGAAALALEPPQAATSAASLPDPRVPR